MNFVKLIVTQLLLLLGISAHSQVGYAIVTPNCQSIAYLYKNSISHAIVDSITNDSINEVYYCVSIKRSTNKRALVSSFIDDEKLTLHQGWVDWKYLGIRLNCDTIFIRHQPCSYSKVRSVIVLPQWIDVYPVKRAQDGWLYIKDKNKNIIGWVDPKYQCANPYTTCN